MSNNTDTIRQGVVSSINYEEGSIRVLYQDRNDAVTAEVPLQTFEYDMPRVGEDVYVAHQSNGVEKAIVLSRYYRDNEKPVEFGPHIWRKELRDDSGSFLKFDRDTHTLTINVADSPGISINIIAAKDVNITTDGSVNVAAKEDVNVSAEGDVTMKAKGSMSIEAEGGILMKSAGNIGLDAARIDLNGG